MPLRCHRNGLAPGFAYEQSPSLQIESHGLLPPSDLLAVRPEISGEEGRVGSIPTPGTVRDRVVIVLTSSDDVVRSVASRRGWSVFDPFASRRRRWPVGSSVSQSRRRVSAKLDPPTEWMTWAPVKP